MRWLDTAYKYLGTKEIKGAKHNPLILKWWAAIRAPFLDDEQPWCAAFVGGVLEECGIRSSRSASARSYLRWGRKIDIPAVGCIVVFWRGSPQSWSGHVGFLVGVDRSGNYMVLGGNQGDTVTIAPFARTRTLGLRWPEGVADASVFKLPLIHSDGTVSTNEA